MDLSIVLIGAVVFLVIFFWLWDATRNLPPSPMRSLPIVGHLFYLSPDPRAQFKEFRKRCGDIYSLYMGGTLVVVLNGYDLIKEAFVKKGDVISNRPHLYSDLLRSAVIWRTLRSDLRNRLALSKNTRMELTTLLVWAVVFLIAFFLLRRPDPRLPPRPLRPLPIVGHLLYMANDCRPQFREWRRQCGDIYSLYLGRTLVVVLNGFDLIKEALVKKADIFSDRPPYFANESIGMDDKGVIFSNGANWKEQRSVGLSILRTFGMGKNLLAEKIQDEAACYIKYLASLNGTPTNIRIMTNISTSNIICSILIGHRFEYDDKDFQELMHKLTSLVNDQQNTSIVNFFFWLRYLPGDLFSAKRIEANMRAIMALLAKFIEEKRRHVDDANDVCNLIDAYIIERNKKIQSGVPTSLDDQNLLKIMMDLFGAGSETTSTTIYWCVLYMLRHPDVQDKVYQEIKDKVGTDRAPTIQDKTQLTYLNAVILETQRLASIVPLSLTHICSEDVTLKGYTVPKGAYILPNLDTALHDKDTWGEDASSFKPERFIDENGKIQIPEQFIPFSIGRRVCLGEAIAKMELFLFLSTMFQRFHFLPAVPCTGQQIECDCGLIIAPKPFKVKAIERK